MALFPKDPIFDKYPGGPSEQVFVPLTELENIQPLGPLNGAAGIIRDYVSSRWREFLEGTGIRRPRRREGVPETPSGGTRYASALSGYSDTDRLAYQLSVQDAENAGYPVREVDQGILRRLAGNVYTGKTLAGFENGREIFVHYKQPVGEKIKTIGHELYALLHRKSNEDHSKYESAAIAFEPQFLAAKQADARQLIEELAAA